MVSSADNIDGFEPLWTTGGLSRRSLLGVAVLGAAGFAGLTGCSGADVSDEVARRHRSGILQIGIDGAPSNINPLDSGSERTRWISEPVVESLYAYDTNLKSVPLLADGEPQISANGLTWTIRLRDGITWHNGDPLAAADLVATLQHLVNLSSGSEWVTYMLGYLQSFTALDRLTVEIRLARPYGLLRSHLTNLPVSHHGYVDRKDAMMGTGPFKLDSYTPGQSFVMSAYQGYHGQRPALSGIRYTVFEDGATRLLGLKQGKLDLITSVPYELLKSAQSDPDLAVTVVMAPLDILSYVNLGKEPFNDENFRRAVAIATDRAGVRSRVFGNQGMPGQGPIGPAELGHDPGLTVYRAEPDLELAKEYLAKAATKRRSFTLTIGTSATIRNIATVLAAGWAEIGITAHIDQIPGGQWSNRLVGRNYEMIMEMFQSGFTAGPANYMALAPADPSNVLSFHYDNPELTALTATVWQTTDDAEREQALRRINRILAENMIVFPPAYPPLIVAQRREASLVDRRMLQISRIAPHTLSFVS